MIYIINFGSSKTSNIQQVVTSLGYECTIIPWEQTEKIDRTKATAYILSGSPTLLTEKSPEPYLEKISFLKNVTAPVLGICFGHQLLGLLFGASIYKGKAIRTSTEIKIFNHSNIFNGFNESEHFEEDHTEGITFPTTFICLASSGEYENEAMKHPSKNIFGVQFHPEVSGENGKMLLKNFLTLTSSKS